MNTNILSTRGVINLTLIALALTALPMATLAQQQPITGQMMDGHATTRAAVPQAPAPPAQATHQSATAPLPATDTSSAPMASAPLASPPASIDYVPAPIYYAAHVGDTTHHLLQMQARGDHAGPPRPMLGAQGSASYQRYLKSFDHPIPEFYEGTVGKNTHNGR